MQFTDSPSVCSDGTVLDAVQLRMYEGLLEDHANLPERSGLAGLLFGRRYGHLEVAICAPGVSKPKGYRFVSAIRIDPDRGEDRESLKRVFGHAYEQKGVKARLLRVDPHPNPGDDEYGARVAVYQLYIPRI